MKKYLETNKNENMTEMLCDAAKAVPTEKFIVIQACLRKQGKSQINKLSLHLKELENEE